MDACVGAACTGNAPFLAKDLLYRLFQLGLDGAAVRLDLPAAIAGAVVGDGEFDVSCHSYC